MTEHTVTKDLMLLCLADWRHSLTSPDVTPFAGKWAEHEEDAYNAIRSTLESHAALEKENAELKARLGDISTTSFYALKDAYTALKEWKAGVVERAIRALMPKKIDPDEAEHIIRDIAAEGEKK